MPRDDFVYPPRNKDYAAAYQRKSVRCGYQKRCFSRRGNTDDEKTDKRVAVNVISERRSVPLIYPKTASETFLKAETTLSLFSSGMRDDIAAPTPSMSAMR